MATEVKISGGNSITLTVNENVLTSVTSEKNKIEVTQSPVSQTVVSTETVRTPLRVTQGPKNKISVTEQVVRAVELTTPTRNEISVLGQGVKGDKGDQGLPGVDGGGLVSLFHDPSPQLSFGLDVMTHNIFSSVEDQGITFTPNGTGHINLDGTVKFKRFDFVPDAFAGGMYADDQDNLYFGVEADE